MIIKQKNENRLMVCQILVRAITRVYRRSIVLWSLVRTMPDKVWPDMMITTGFTTGPILQTWPYARW